jgi:DeoR family fructose operon transcriptional repressor
VELEGTLAGDERLARIRGLLDRDGRVRIAPLAVELEVSEMTIRRDLQELEAMGCARRVRGGAMAVGPEPFADRHRHRARAKAQIAAKLVRMVPSTGSIGIDASSTLLRLANSLAGGRDLIVVTNALETFRALSGKAGITAHCTGGTLEPRTGSLVGPLACRGATQVLLQRFFMSAASIDPVIGPSETSLDEAEVKRAFVGVAAEVVLAVDSSKLSTRATGMSVGWERIDMLVTELDPTDERLDPYRGLAAIR